MLVACRLAGVSALERQYAGVNARAQCGPTQSPIAAGERGRLGGHRQARAGGLMERMA